MLMKIKDAVLTGVQQGLPVVTTVVGGMLGSSRTDKVYKVGVYAGLGWLAGYITQRGLFALLTPKMSMPEESGAIAPQYGGKPKEQMPPVEVPSVPKVERKEPIEDNPYGSTGFDPSSMGS